MSQLYTIRGVNTLVSKTIYYYNIIRSSFFTYIQSTTYKALFLNSMQVSKISVWNKMYNIDILYKYYNSNCFTKYKSLFGVVTYYNICITLFILKI